MASVYDVKKATTDNSIQTVLDSKSRAKKTFVESYTITLDDGTTDDSMTVESAAQASGDLPSERESHPDRPSFEVKNVSTKRVSVVYYESTVTYETPEYKEGEEDSSPLELAAEVEFFSVVEDREVDDDFNGDPLVNEGTKEPFSIVTEQTDLGVTITKNMETFNPSSIYLFNNKVNNGNFLGFPAGTAKIHDIKAKNAATEDVAYWVVTVQILFREPRADDPDEESWYQRVLHQGYYAMFDGVKRRIREAADGTLGTEGDPITQPELLNEEGELLADGEDPYFLKKQQFGTIDFDSLGLF